MPFDAKVVNNGDLSYIDFGQFKICKYKNIEFSLKVKTVDKDLSATDVYELLLNNKASIESEYPEEPAIWLNNKKVVVYIPNQETEPSLIGVSSNNIIKDVMLELLGVKSGLEFGLYNCWYKNGKLHREAGPAIIEWNSDEKVIHKEYYQDGLLHRENGPAVIKWSNTQKLLCKGYYKYGRLNQFKLDPQKYPALVEYDKDGLMIRQEWENGEINLFYPNGKIRCIKDKHEIYYDHYGTVLFASEFDSIEEDLTYKSTNNGEDEPTLIKFYKDHTIEIVEFRNQHNLLHRVDKPAYIKYNSSGKIILEKWYLEGKLHREDGPAYVKYGQSGNPIREEYQQNNELYNPNGPVIKKYQFGQLVHEEYQKNGKLHRESGPALREWSKIGQLILEKWCLEGKLHREDGPALQKWSDSGQLILEEYRQAGKYYRENDLPAKIEYQDNLLHRQMWIQRINPNDPIGIEYYPAGSIKLKNFDHYGINYYPTQEINHRLTLKNKKLFVYDDKPSYTEYYKSGAIKKIMYRLDTILHRLNGPAVIEYNEAGNIILEEYYENNIKLR